MGTRWVALVAAAAAMVASASAAASAMKASASDPCQFRTCPAGERCVVHEVSCTARSCPRIGECRPVDCGLSCPPGLECRREPGSPARCAPVRDACGGRCLSDEQCLEVVEPCLVPPCLQQQLCIGSDRVTARRLPPACPAEAVCEAGFQCVMTKVCRMPGDCAFQMSCIPPPRQPDCTSHWCDAGEQCRMQEVECTAPPCGVRPVCVAAEPPSCSPACAPDQECTLAVAPCLVAPCPVLPRCTPRLPALSSRFGSPFGFRGGRRGECPVNDLKDIASKAFCDNARLDQCMADRDCGGERRCCERGCGNTCLPACPHRCADGEHCRLVRVQCIGAPCPKVAQCVAAPEPEDGESLLTEEASRDRPVRPPAAQQEAAASFERPASSFQPRPATTTTTRRPRPRPSSRRPAAATARPTTTPRPNFGPFGPGGEPIGPGFFPAEEGAECDGQVCRPGERCRDVPCDKQPPLLCPRRCQPVPPPKPGDCPANEQPPSVICFQDRFKDLCFDDVDCEGSSRCCLNGCSRQCRPVCAGCQRDEQCRILPGASRPVCVPLRRVGFFLGI